MIKFYGAHTRNVTYVSTTFLSIIIYVSFSVRDKIFHNETQTRACGEGVCGLWSLWRCFVTGQIGGQHVVACVDAGRRPRPPETVDRDASRPTPRRHHGGEPPFALRGDRWAPTWRTPAGREGRIARGSSSGSATLPACRDRAARANPIVPESFAGHHAPGQGASDPE